MADGMAEMADGMEDGMEEWRNGGMAKMAAEWRNGRMAGMATYLLHLWHTPTTTPTPFNLVLLNKPIGASPGCNYVLTRMVIQII